MKILIRQVRDQKGITLDELSLKTGISRRTIIRYEQDNLSPTLKTLEKIANALEVDVLDLIVWSTYNKR